MYSRSAVPFASFNLLYPRRRKSPAEGKGGRHGPTRRGMYFTDVLYTQRNSGKYVLTTQYYRFPEAALCRSLYHMSTLDHPVCFLVRKATCPSRPRNEQCHSVGSDQRVAPPFHKAQAESLNICGFIHAVISTQESTLKEPESASQAVAT